VINTDALIALYAAMWRIRRVEEVFAERYAEQQMRCPMHLCIGHEAIAAGVCGALRNDDIVYSNHRAHGHYLAKQGDLQALVAELYGRSSGCCGGRGGSMHLIDKRVGFMGSTPIVGGTIPLAVGAAWAAKLQGKERVSCVFFGDGCFEEGVVHESLNFAALHHLPVLFVCENNRYSVYTKLDARQPDRPIHGIAQAHGCQVYHGDGSDVEYVYKCAADSAMLIRHGGGPCFLELDVYRWREHCGPDFDHELGYRSGDEVRRGQEADPLRRCRETILGRAGVTEQHLDDMHGDIEKEISRAFALAQSSPDATFDLGGKHVYADE